MVNMIHVGLSGPRQGSPQPPKYPESGSGTIRPVSKQSNSLFWIRTEPAQSLRWQPIHVSEVAHLGQVPKEFVTSALMSP